MESYLLFTIDYLSEGDTASTNDFKESYFGLDSAKEVALDMCSIAVGHFLFNYTA